ncbi:MAG: hypothetical protein J1F04_02190 [Oscillospiraceae bacterium]|nr:hypothetical protein [Oscillospiraceae bacterium]
MRKIAEVLGVLFVVSTLSMLMFGANASAYLDPSVMTYLIQAIAGVGIAVAAAVGIGIRRAKKKLNNKLGIDENKNKEVESDEITVNIDDTEDKQ